MPRLAQQIVDKAKGFACGLYKNVPRALVPNPGEDALRWAWDSLCDPPSDPDNPNLPGLPPPPARPWEGGMCGGIVYGGYIFNGVSSREIYSGADAPGPIKVWRLRYGQAPNPGTQRIYFCLEGTPRYSGDTAAAYREVIIDSPNGVPNADIPKYQLLKPRRKDGQPDNCGDPPKTYPDASPAPPGGFTSPPTPITLNDNDTTNVTFNFKPPTVVSPALNIPPVVVNVASPSVNIPISFNFDGIVNIGAPSAPPVVIPPEIEDKLDKIGDGLDDLQEDWNFEHNPPDLDFEPDINKDDAPVENGEKKDDVPGILALKVTLTRLPDKAQYGSPTVYFAGWITFKLQGGYTPREQINFEESYFLAPPGATGYGLTLTNGAEGDIRVYSKVAQEG